MTTAIIGIGPPGSGRVNFFKQLLSDDIDVIYCHWDECYGKFDGLNHAAETAIAGKKFLDNIAAALRQGHSVIADATNVDPSTRQKLVAFCREHGAGQIIGVIINAPEKSHQNIAFTEDRCRAHIREILQQMLVRWPPSPAEGFDQIKNLAAFFPHRNS